MAKDSILLYALVFATAFMITVILTPLAIRLGRRGGLVAKAGGRRRHVGAVVRIGGLSLFPAYALAVLLPVWLNVPRQDPLELGRLYGMLGGMAVIWCMGLVDDKYQLSSVPQLGSILVATAIAMGGKVFVEVFNSPFGDEQVWVDWYLMVPITVVWLGGMTGTLDWLDGLDGLATGVTAIASVVLFLHMLRLEQYTVAVLPLALIACSLAFLLFNSSPARIYLGGGAYLLGFALGTISIIAGAKVASALLILWLPILDVAWQIYTRWRRGQPIFLGDRGHLHLRLKDLGWSDRKIVAIYYGITALLGWIALGISSRELKLAILVLAGLLIIFALAILAKSTGDETPTGR